MLLVLVLPLLLGGACAAPAADGGAELPPGEPEPSFPREEASLNEMFREVEELMEDTQHKLRNAVKEMEAEEEGAKNPSEVDFENLPPSYHNESNTDTKIGNKTIHTHQEIDKVTDNKTGSTIYSETVITSIKDGESKRNHEEFCFKITLKRRTGDRHSWHEMALRTSISQIEECIIDEDCEIGKYCQFSSFEYLCQLCKTQHSPCSRDVECCGDQLCAWGECVEAASKGENGTICENQHDCNPGTCCAFQKDLLFPVCTPLPAAGEPCHDPSNKLLNLITWELEPDGVLERCPCANGLICQTHSHSTVSVCEVSFNETRSNEKEDPLLMDEIPLLGLIPRDVLGDYEDSSIIQAVRKELESLEGNISEQTDLKEPDLAHDLLFGDEI
ncbi:dickkopf-related protein 3 isoform X1 [Malaclemys terrapin pileata]|uniref:dickkopf-related protein 3 isoform X1 n=1 Tax=Malaclemys terrapin pileata TaxID=2991368 RepID=UPI0023A8A7F3|nr:dickkopf-related protein 3 isoform X1 [Malaclemys terrapin pileata]XP_053882707.1 dickkopf-related protein 3 isoform X1 [Malaclemys terrapin pileata]